MIKIQMNNFQNMSHLMDFPLDQMSFAVYFYLIYEHKANAQIELPIVVPIVVMVCNIVFAVAIFYGINFLLSNANEEISTTKQTNACNDYILHSDGYCFIKRKEEG